ncbi:MAG: LptF/LptG family permease [Puniceicoccales bacterium]|jgi:lipopolysaccharide export system permease protein|nr:LptF/LptG family permease [Puniceicoccales bacterium]
MKLLDQYILGEFSKKFLLFFVVLNAFLVLEDVYTHLEKFLACCASYGEIFPYYMAHGIELLPLTLPLTFTLTLIFSFCSMHRNCEIILLLSSGVSFFRVTRMFWILGIMASFLSLLGSFHWVPGAQAYSNYYLKGIEMCLAKGDEMEKHLTLRTQNRLWYINRYDKSRGHASEISVHDYDMEGKEWRRIKAKSGYFDGEKKTWILERGREILFHPKTQAVQEVHVFEWRTFGELGDSPQLMLLLRIPPENLPLSQLKIAIDYEKQNGNFENVGYRMQFWSILLDSIFCFLSCWIVLPLLFSTPRENFLWGVSKVTMIALFYGLIAYILHSLGRSGTLHWLFSLLIPVVGISLLPLGWVRKLL